MKLLGDVTTEFQTQNRSCLRGKKGARNKANSLCPLSRAVRPEPAVLSCDKWGPSLSVLCVLCDTHRHRQLPLPLRRRWEPSLTCLPAQPPRPCAPAAPQHPAPWPAHLFSLFCTRPSHSAIWRAFECRPSEGPSLTTLFKQPHCPPTLLI